MTLTNKSQILGVQSTNDASKVKVAYNDGGVLKRVIVGSSNSIVTDWLDEGNSQEEYKAPDSQFNHPSPVIR